jgi:Flp pilus assembly protein TadG
VIIELAMVAMVLLVMSSGAFDYGRAWQSGLALNEAARAGARTASAQGNVRGADFYALSSMKAALTANGRIGGVERIVIYQATATNGRVPDACKTGTSTSCQVITGASFRTSWETLSVTDATGTTGCLNIASSTGWCPTTRDAAQATAQYYGVWIRYSQDNLFRLTGNTSTLEKWAVMRLEPKGE